MPQKEIIVPSSKHLEPEIDRSSISTVGYDSVVDNRELQDPARRYSCDPVFDRDLDLGGELGGELGGYLGGDLGGDFGGDLPLDRGVAGIVFGVDLSSTDLCKFDL